MVPALLSVFFFCVFVFFSIRIAKHVAHFAFCFTNCVVKLAFWSPSKAVHSAFCFTSCVVMLAF